MTPEQIKKADEIAAFFGLPLDGENESTWQRRYKLPDGGSLDFCESRHAKGQLHIDAWPCHPLQEYRLSYYNGDKPVTEMNVSIAKSAERIAQEIKTRIMPGYKQVVADCREQKALADKRLARDWETMTAIAEPFGEPLKVDRGSVCPFSIYRTPFYMRVQSRSDGVHVEMDLPAASVAQVAKLLADLHPETKEEPCVQEYISMTDNCARR